jgi:hypothetical protein
MDFSIIRFFRNVKQYLEPFRIPRFLCNKFEYYEIIML